LQEFTASEPLLLLVSSGIGDPRGPRRRGREGHRQHPDFRRRPPPAQHAL